ncbi:Acetate kinase [Tetrabaena socialis]|uniref:Acetate kinase n=1 Tax=Tetrabaena socialis TaxID=47790 RepID=A0A2J8A3H5_9CHLO|nr:Acetate kinase [Tetrabaena socialis]|eukprot:PNH07071.1 Acetate kinase [Tetrabaena socialis]
MGTRCGDMDPAVVLHIQNQLGLSAKETDTLLNKKSGLLGVTGSSDLRAVIDAAHRGEPRGQLGLAMFVHRVKKYIGSYMAVLDGQRVAAWKTRPDCDVAYLSRAALSKPPAQVDAVIFSAGIGENSSIIRGLILDRMQGMGLEVDPALNARMVGGKQGDIATAASRVRLLVIPTDEEQCIAQQTLQVVARAGGMAA